MRVPRLTEDKIAERLTRVPEWVRVGEAIMRTYSFKSFRLAVAFVGRVADAAEEADHHPDINVRYKKVMLSLTTHDSLGLTTNDFDLAVACDELSEDMLAGGGL